jgi:hypothetical protein
LPEVEEDGNGDPLSGDKIPHRRGFIFDRDSDDGKRVDGVR